MAQTTGSLYYTRGACKLYRRECCARINPIGTRPGRDGQYKARANGYGWTTRGFLEEGLYHNRPAGAMVGLLRLCRDMGRSDYCVVFYAAFMGLRALAWLHKRPHLLGSLAMLLGWLDRYWRHWPREDRKELLWFIRREQIVRLLGRTTVWQ